MVAPLVWWYLLLNGDHVPGDLRIGAVRLVGAVLLPDGESQLDGDHVLLACFGDLVLLFGHDGEEHLVDGDEHHWTIPPPPFGFHLPPQDAVL